MIEVNLKWVIAVGASTSTSSHGRCVISGPPPSLPPWFPPAAATPFGARAETSVGVLILRGRSPLPWAQTHFPVVQPRVTFYTRHLFKNASKRQHVSARTKGKSMTKTRGSVVVTSFAQPRFVQTSYIFTFLWSFPLKQRLNDGERKAFSLTDVRERPHELVMDEDKKIKIKPI